MALKNLTCLVLRGAVRLVGKASNLRLVSGPAAKPEIPEIDISTRCPSHGGKQELQTAWRRGHADYSRMDTSAVFGAGRSHRCAAVLSRSRIRHASGVATALA